jgi:hypothetical protein
MAGQALSGVYVEFRKVTKRELNHFLDDALVSIRANRVCHAKP